MSKARTLAGVVSTGAVLADGVIDAAEIGNLTLPTGGDIVGTTASQTLTGKTIAFANNTLTGVQAALTSGTTIKTVGGVSLLGSGDVSIDTATNLAGGSNGTIPYQSAAGTTQMLAVGSAGQLLKSNGVAAPSWVTPSAGALILLSTITASAAATVDLENTIDSTYDTYMVVASGFTISDASNGVRVRYKVAGAYVDSATYVFQRLRITSDFGTYATTQAGYASPANAISIINNIGNSGGACGSFTLYLYKPSSTTVNKQIIWQSAGIAADLETSLSPGAGQNTGTGAVTGLRFVATAGTITGTFRLYGVANS